MFAEHMLMIVEMLQKDHHMVDTTGDDVNDEPDAGSAVNHAPTIHVL